MVEGTRLKDLQEGFMAFKQSTESHIQHSESQFTTIEAEMLAMRRQMEAMMQQFSGVAADLHNVNKIISAGAHHTGENSNANQLTPHTGEIFPRTLRLDFPIFTGDNPLGWLYKVNQFFSFHNTLPQHRLRLVSFHVEGKALVWFQDLDESGVLSTWEAFVQALLLRFGPSSYDDPVEQLTRLRQVGTVEEYKSHFEELSNRLRGLSESFKLSCFLSGLKDEIRLTVRMFDPTSLMAAYGLAKIQEEKVLLYKKHNQRPSTNSYTEPAIFKSKTLYQTPQQLTQTPSKPANTTSSNAIVPVQKISQNQMKERREKGLCYHCDSKWNPGHRCHNPKLYLIEEVEENQPLIEHDTGQVSDQGEVVQILDKGKCPEISLHAILGSLNPKTMRIRGRIGNQAVTILIDSGSTHNFLDPALLTRVPLAVNEEERVKVKVANGDQIQSEGKAVGVNINMQGHLFTMDLYVLVLAGCDIVLGVQWLQGLGSILWNFQQLTMQFTHKSALVTLKGLSSTKLIEEGKLPSSKSLEQKGLLLQFMKGRKKIDPWLNFWCAGRDNLQRMLHGNPTIHFVLHILTLWARCFREGGSCYTPNTEAG
ncbi:hypothetical protein I3843_15G081700 [Carya illinoinensis]|nr:hypothetical protein I3760_15G084900 [Carya illinoinensis]KAG7944095.1 hypothetical protein I3843_15G081700 [Carya illinoinensis]